jgi:hypothetical protein
MTRKKQSEGSKEGVMKNPKPLTDESGEVRELLAEDMKRFRPAREILTPSLAAKLGVECARGDARTRLKRESPRGPRIKRRDQ